MKQKKKGFTLVEMLIVIAIIAVLGGVMLTQFSGSTESALATNCLNNMRILSTAVLAEASQENYYPAAGPFQYLDIDSNSEDYNKIIWHQGWIGQAEGNAMVSCYYDDELGQNQHYAITNGTIWRAVGGKRDAYVCPAHTKCCTRAKQPRPAWSYAMNSFFGWDYGKVAGVDGGRRGYGSGAFAFRYTANPKSRSRPAEKVLLFGEIPFAENGVQVPKFSTAAGAENDMVLQYDNDNGADSKANKAGDSASEAIGFNHKVGNDYCAHVAFADGHCEKLILPRGGDDDNLFDLTTWLCTGQEYTLNGGRYEKVSE